MSAFPALEAAKAVNVLLAKATGCESRIGVPRDIVAGDVGVLLDMSATFALNESGGDSDSVTTIRCYDCQGVRGSSTGDLESAGAVIGHVGALKALVEADVHLGGAVSQARLSKCDIYTNQAADNAYEAMAVIEVEVTQW